jgi:thiosulfate/3-mercaptopyruvate sulfurtransferase
MTFSTLVSTAELAEHVDDPDWLVLDARFTLDDESWGTRAYAEGHIPGAVRADLGTDMSGPIVEGVTGRRPFPEPADFAATLSAWGVGPTTQVVAYDADNGLMAASRLWFMLRWMGHDAVAVLDGGIQRWTSEGRSLRPGIETRASVEFDAKPRTEMLAFVEEVDRVRRDPAYRVFDSRGAEGYHGGGVYHDPVRGHIAGAGLADRAETIAENGGLRDQGALLSHYQSLIGDTPVENVIFYCGSGVTAAQNVLAMTHAGLPGSRMYVGSWSEWITDPSREHEL